MKSPDFVTHTFDLPTFDTELSAENLGFPTCWQLKLPTSTEPELRLKPKVLPPPACAKAQLTARAAASHAHS